MTPTFLYARIITLRPYRKKKAMAENKFYIGIDPGNSGGIAAVNPSTGSVLLFDMPTLTVVGTKSKKYVDAHTLSAILSGFLENEETGVRPPLAVVEAVNAMPGQGVVSMFNFGMGYGIIQGVIAALKIRSTRVSPVRWKKFMLQDMGKDKDASIARALELYPQSANQIVGIRKKKDGLAEALLLAHYATFFAHEI
jgi:crossover junction endodeoxyribonuclease RuvC